MLFWVVFLMDLGGFWSSFLWFWDAKRCLKRQRQKYEKPMIFLSKIDVFKASGHQNRHEHFNKIGSAKGMRFEMTCLGFCLQAKSEKMLSET